MLKLQDIKSIRDYYLNFRTKADRQAYALSLNNDILLKFIDAIDQVFFDTLSSNEDELNQVLHNFNFENNKKRIRELQEEIYLDVAGRYLNNQIDDDVTRLISSGNSLFKEILEQEKVFSKNVKSAFLLNEKERLKQQFQELEKAKKNSRKLSNKSIRFAICIAAAASLILFIWQPFKLGNDQLFSNYLASANTTLPPVSRIDFRVETNDQTRSGNITTISGFTYEESGLIFSSLNLMKSGNFIAAKLSLEKASVTKEKNPEILIYLAIAQLNTSETEKAIENLQFLSNVPNYTFSQEVKYHLAMAYLKVNRNKDAKALLHQLVKEHEAYSKESEKILRQMRLF
jgi:hypothetical protein